MIKIELMKFKYYRLSYTWVKRKLLASPSPNRLIKLSESYHSQVTYNTCVLLYFFSCWLGYLYIVANIREERNGFFEASWLLLHLVSLTKIFRVNIILWNFLVWVVCTDVIYFYSHTLANPSTNWIASFCVCVCTFYLYLHKLWRYLKLVCMSVY